MILQELSICLWAAARLQGTVPEVSTTVPAIAACILHQADDMNGQDLSNSLWAVAKLKDTVPKVLVAMKALVMRIPSKISGMQPEGLRMSLWAAAELGEDGLANQLKRELARRNLH